MNLNERKTRYRCLQPKLDIERTEDRASLLVAVVRYLPTLYKEEKNTFLKKKFRHFLYEHTKLQDMNIHISKELGFSSKV